MVFHYNEDESVTTLDPAFVKSQSEIWIVSQIFNGLVDLSPQLQVVPALSDRWEISADKKIYTFHLRSDAQFCLPDDGGKVTHRNGIWDARPSSVTQLNYQVVVWSIGEVYFLFCCSFFLRQGSELN